MRLPKSTPAKAFTLIELLVVIAIIAVLAAMLLPTLSRAKATSLGIHCENNLYQLTLAWVMYSGDFNDRLVPSDGGGEVNIDSPTGTYSDNSWCMGDMTEYPGWTNTGVIKASLLFPNVKNVAVYRCPADKSSADSKKKIIYPYGGGGDSRVRSVSMNGWMDGPAVMQSGSIGTIFHKIGEIGKPADMFVFLDENPGSINDGFFYTSIPNTVWTDVPGTYHNNANGMSFADGHALIKTWHDRAILGQNVKTDNGNGVNFKPEDGGVDLRWMHQHATYPVPASD
jgi:prepilin-type N-terminal cleavage/methylation domain-containing protein